MSFSQAARLCRLSQPALSANVKRLEETLGARLFDRHTRKVSLTAVGEEFLEVAQGLTENMELALARMQGFVAGKRGRLIVKAAPSIAASFAPQVIAAFLKEHPQIDVELHDELSDVCVESVRNGTADLVLAPFKPKAADLEQSQLFRDHLVVICPAGHALGQRSLVRWRDVQPYPHIVMNRNSSVRQLIDAEYARYGVALRPAFEVAHVGTLLGLVAADLGVGELPQSLIENIDMAGLVYRRINNAAAYRTICAITSRNRSSAPSVGSFVKICRQYAKRRVEEQASA
jgi:DNA-binding transcriptional LysR family regulator